MSALATIERNRSGHNVYAPDMSAAERLADAINGSRLLRDAILRAKGHNPKPQPIVFIKFEEPKRPVGRPKGSCDSYKRKSHGKRKRGRPLGTLKPRNESAKIAKIRVLICAHFKLSEKDLVKRSREQEFSHPRQIAMYLARKTTTASYPDIAIQFGGLDHTTVIHAVRAVEKRVASLDMKTLQAIVAVHEVIGG